MTAADPGTPATGEMAHADRENEPHTHPKDQGTSVGGPAAALETGLEESLNRDDEAPDLTEE
jgi:hypothetical protein